MFLQEIVISLQEILNCKKENKELKRMLKEERRKTERLEAQISQERKCGEYCSVCKHSFIKRVPYSVATTYGCLLDCDCKDFDVVDQD